MQQTQKKKTKREIFKQELTEKQKKDIKEAFDLFDVDGSGNILTQAPSISKSLKWL